MRQSALADSAHGTSKDPQIEISSKAKLPSWDTSGGGDRRKVSEPLKKWPFHKKNSQFSGLLSFLESEPNSLKAPNSRSSWPKSGKLKIVQTRVSKFKLKRLVWQNFEAGVSRSYTGSCLHYARAPRETLNQISLEAPESRFQDSNLYYEVFLGL